MKTSDILKSAKALIATPDTWCQRSVINRENGVFQRCSIGALGHIVLGPYLHFSSNYYHAISYLNNVVGICPDDKPSGISPIAYFNDNNSHKKVMEVWDKAIQWAEQDEIGQSIQ